MRKHNVGAVLFGLLEGLLLLRLVALLFAARPDNPLIIVILALTAPLVAPFRRLDQLAGQPQFGARLELATLAAMVVLISIAAVLQWWSLKRVKDQQRGDHHAQSQRFDRKADRQSGQW